MHDPTQTAMPTRPAAMPQGLPGFTETPRFWERDTGRWTVKLLPGECYVTRQDEDIVTVLGSCISACIRDPDTGLVGMNHFMLPDRRESFSGYPATGFNEINRYGCFALESLIKHPARDGAR